MMESILLSGDINRSLIWATFSCLGFSFQHALLQIVCSGLKRKLSLKQSNDDSKLHSVSLTILQVLDASPPVTVANCIVASTHALLAVFLGLLCFAYDFRPCGEPLTPIQRMTMAVSLGYFVYDIAFEGIVTRGLAMVAHHVVAIVSIAFALHLDSCGTEIIGRRVLFVCASLLY